MNNPRVRNRRPTKQTALLAWLYSGLACAKSSARASTCLSASGGLSPKEAEVNRRLLSEALRSRARSIRD